MKNFNILGVHGKIWVLGPEGFHEKPKYRGGLPKTEGLGGQFADLRVGGGLGKKEGVGVVFLRGDWYPNAHYVDFCSAGVIQGFSLNLNLYLLTFL